MRSAEQVALELPVAGPTSRMLAYAVDWVILWSVVWGIVVLVLFGTSLVQNLLEGVQAWLERLGAGGGGDGPSGLAFAAGIALFVLLVAFAEISYFVFWELTNHGRSPGKALLGLRVVADGGRPLTPAASLLRNLLRVVDVLPATYVTGFLSMIVSREGKRLGDLAAGTLVVRLDRPQRALPLGSGRAPADAHAHRFERGHLARIGRTERTLLRQTLRRIEGLSAERADAALERATEVLRARIGYEAEVPPDERRAFLVALLQTAARRR